MAKVDRLQTDEVFTVGFVPSYDLPDARPNSIDPFLEPLVREIETGYIEGRQKQIFMRQCKHTNFMCLTKVSYTISFLSFE